MVYQWRDGSRWKVKAQVAGEHIEQLRFSNGGALTPRDVVEDARGEASPIHVAFEWNDAKAADEYRIAQARQLIADVMIVFADEIEGAPKEPVRAFASVPTSATPIYTSTLDAIRSPEMRGAVLSQARRELDAWRRRYKHYQELAIAVDRVGETIELIPAA